MISSSSRYYIAKKPENRVHELTDSNVSRPIRVVVRLITGRNRIRASGCPVVHAHALTAHRGDRDFQRLRNASQVAKSSYSRLAVFPELI